MTKIFSSLSMLIALSTSVSAFAQIHYDDISSEGEAYRSSSHATSSSVDPVLLQGIWSCGQGVLDGVWNSTGGAVVGASTCISNPVKCGSDAMDGAKNAYRFVTNLVPEVQKMTQALGKLPPEELSQIACSSMASLGTDALLALMTAGLAEAKLAATLARIATRITEAVELGKRFAFLKMTTVLRSGQATANRLKKLYDDGFGKLIQMGAPACAL